MKEGKLIISSNPKKNFNVLKQLKGTVEWHFRFTTVP